MSPPVPRYGADPTWYPGTLGQRALVMALGLVFLWLWAPLRVTHALLGWARVDWVLLDLISIPGALMRVLGTLGGARWGDQANALEHTHLVCRLCPPARRALRDPHGSGICAWNTRWNQGDFTIPPHFGGVNWLRQYTGRTELDGYDHLAGAPAADALPGLPPPNPLPIAARWGISVALNAVLMACLMLVAS